MYNEDDDELDRSLKGVASNLEALQRYRLSWENVLVVMLVDGRSKANPKTLKYMKEKLHIYDESMILERLNHSDVTMHMFERTVALPKHTAQNKYYPPLQLMLALKERNGGKLNSHLWYFAGFCKNVNPKYTFLLDVGTQPKKDALALLYTEMENNPQVGGCCGEIAVRKPRIYKVLEAAQHFEYKISHVLDKSMESVFGYISVLPGAFSAYRFEAISGPPLTSYFYVEENSAKEMGPFKCNMYLAEDRVLCFELVAREERDWILSYVKGAVAETDVPQNILELIKQRRRWLNGSFFSLVFYLTNFSRINTESAHSIIRKFFLTIQFLYQLSSIILNWVTVGSLYLSYVLVFNMTFEALDQVNQDEDSIPGDGVADELQYAFSLSYTLLTILQFLVGLGGKANDTHSIYYVCFMVYGVIMVAAMGLSAWHMATLAFNEFIILAALISFIVYAFTSLLHGEFFAIAVVLIQYLFTLPTFVNMFTIYRYVPESGCCADVLNSHRCSVSVTCMTFRGAQRRAT